MTAPLRIILAAGLAALSGAVRAAQPQAAAQPLPTAIAGQPYTLVFADEFNRLDLNKGERGPLNWFNGVWYRGNYVILRAPRSAIRVEDGALRLIWTRAMLRPRSWHGTGITTASPQAGGNGRAWHYGYFEARMRWTPETGAWPAIWMYDSPYVIGTTERGCELDIFEGQGKEPTYYATSHDWTGNKDVMNEGNRIPVSVDYREYHTYGLLWTPETLSWYLDGRLLLTSPTPDVCRDRPLYFILQMAVGSGFRQADTTGMTGKEILTMDVDWVRIYQRDR